MERDIDDMVKIIGVIKARDGSENSSSGAKLIFKDEKGRFMIAGGVRVDIQDGALQLMLKKGAARLYDF